MNAGFRPFNWNCHDGGRGENCFNLKRRPKFGVFYDCFPGRISFTDVDGLVEISGCFCLLEWKGDGGSIKRGQERSYIQFTRWGGNIVFVVNGDAETMVVRDYCIFWDGKRLPTVPADLNGVKARLRKWADWVQREQKAA